MKTICYQFEVFDRDPETGEVCDLYASGDAPTLEEARQFARGYSLGDFAAYATFLYQRIELEAF